MDNLKPAVRSLLANPATTVVMIATLAVAIGANTAIFSVLQGVLLRPLGYGQDDGLVVVWATPESDSAENFRLSPADYRDLRDGIRGFDGQVALYRSIGSTLTALNPPVRVGSYAVTPRLFQVLGTQPAAGQFFNDQSQVAGGRRMVVLTYASWTNRFGGDPEIVGSTIELDSVPHTVVAVAEQGFQFPPGNREAEMYLPMFLSDAILLERDHRMFDSIARLKEGTTIVAAQAEMDVMAQQLAREFPETNQGWGLIARPLRQELFGDLSTTLWVLSGAVFLVLLVACANIANVQVARSTIAGREFAVRAALGARRGDLLQRALAESILLGALGGVCAIPLAFWGVSFVRSVMPAEIPRIASIGIDSGVLLFAAVLSIGSGVLFGSIAAWRSMTPDVSGLLKPVTLDVSAAGGRRLRELMVVVEVALAIVLLVGAGLMVRSFSRLSEVDPGFRQDGVVSVAVKLPRSRYTIVEWKAFFERLVSRVRELPGVTAAGAVSDLPMSDVGLGFEMEFTLPGLDTLAPTARPNADFRLVLPGYFEAMEMEILSGRGFDTRDAASGLNSAIVNETLVRRYFRDIDPIGRSVSLGPQGSLEIVGVVADIRHGGLQSRYESEIFLPYGRISTAEMHIVVQSDLPTASVANAVGGVLSEMDPDLASSQVAAIADLLWESAAQPRFNTALLSSLALCAALLAAFGIYGIVSFLVSQRTREIGVRMALGADSRATVTMMVRQALAIVLTGAVLGLLGALAASRFLNRLLFEVEATDPTTYALVFLAVLLIGFLAAWLPARRATRIDPMAALRAD